MSTTIINSPRYLTQQHRSPHSPHSSSPPNGSNTPNPRSFHSAPLFKSPASPPAPAEKHQPPSPLPQVIPQQPTGGGEWQQGYPLSAEEERRRRKQVEEAEGWSVLASQHHKSEYNRLKWGDKGSRLYYVPLSIQLPSHVQDVMSKQAIFEDYCAHQQQRANDHLNHSTTTDSLPLPSTSCSNDKDGCMGDEESREMGGRRTPPRDLEQEEGLEGTLVSDELEVEGGGGGDQEESKIRAAVAVEDQILQAMQDQLVVPFPTPPSSQPSPTPSNHLPLATSTSNSNGPVARPVAAVFSSIEAGRGDYAIRQQENGGVEQQHHVVVAQAVKTSDSHPINISILIPPSYIPLLHPLLSIHLPPSPPPPGFASSTDTNTSSPLTTNALIPPSPTPSSISPHTISIETFQQPMQPFRLPPLLDLYLLSLSAPSVDNAPPPSTPTLELGDCQTNINGGGGRKVVGKVGNFLLSSCPGKKVRLTGPVKGRGAICRDLKVDLERIRGLGVGCLVCCLDDEELSYLGAPFEEYARNAKLVGLDVIRIPMPEGLTPTSLPIFDAQITHIIRTYTLQGIDVLSHCRGGVGRASIVAGSWAIKMGLIVPPSPVSRYSNVNFVPSTSANLNGGTFGRAAGGGGEREREREEWMRRVGEMEDHATVERVIAVLRRRRSLKAIETYEQVRWLMEYVAWLRVEGVVLELSEQEEGTKE